MADEIKTTPKEEPKDPGINTSTPAWDEAQEKGYFGDVPDPAPDSAYTVEGVTSGEPTAETDPDLLKQAKANVAGDVKGNIF